MFLRSNPHSLFVSEEGEIDDCGNGDNDDGGVIVDIVEGDVVNDGVVCFGGKRASRILKHCALLPSTSCIISCS